MRFSVVLMWDSEDQIWIAEVPALDGAATSGDTVAEALAMARDMIAVLNSDLETHDEPLPDEEVEIQLHTVELDDEDFAVRRAQRGSEIPPRAPRRSGSALGRDDKRGCRKVRRRLPLVT